jgi:hypothetical protein
MWASIAAEVLATIVLVMCLWVVNQKLTSCCVGVKRLNKKLTKHIGESERRMGACEDTINRILRNDKVGAGYLSAEKKAQETDILEAVDMVLGPMAKIALGKHKSKAKKLEAIRKFAFGEGIWAVAPVAAQMGAPYLMGLAEKNGVDPAFVQANLDKVGPAQAALKEAFQQVDAGEELDFEAIMGAAMPEAFNAEQPIQ